MGGGQRDASVERREDCDSRPSHPIGSKEHCCIEGWAFFLPMTHAAAKLIMQDRLLHQVRCHVTIGQLFAGSTDGRSSRQGPCFSQFDSSSHVQPLC